MRESFPLDSLSLLNIKDSKSLKKFYAKWSITASKLIQQYAKDHSKDWFNTAWNRKSKDIPFYIRLIAPKSFTGNVWFASRPTNYAFSKSAGKLSMKRKVLPRGIHAKPVYAYERWFIPKSYKPDYNNINRALTEIEEPSRTFISKGPYKKPLLWFQNKRTKKVGPVTLKEQLADKIADDPETYNLILEAFQMTLDQYD